MIYSRITGTGSYLPEKILTNTELEKTVDTSSEWIIERTGIHQRHISAENETSAMMSTESAKRALAAANVDAKEIDLIIVATCTPDMAFPSTACLVQHNLGITDCIAFDVSAACTGFVYALSIADQFIRNGQVKKALVFGAEVISRAIDWNDRTTCVLFGDGAGGVVLEASDEPGIHSTHLHADGSYKDILYANYPVGADKKAQDYYLKMQGNPLFKIAVKTLGDLVETTLAENNITASQLDWLIPHQANLRIIGATAKKLDISMDKVIITVDQHGNTSAASIPLALDNAIKNGKVKKGQKLLLESFGGGLTWGSALITL